MLAKSWKPRLEDRAFPKFPFSVWTCRINFSFPRRHTCTHEHFYALSEAHRVKTTTIYNTDKWKRHPSAHVGLHTPGMTIATWLHNFPTLQVQPSLPPKLNQAVINFTGSISGSFFFGGADGTPALHAPIESMLLQYWDS